jgi:hypothetical protein
VHVGPFDGILVAEAGRIVVTSATPPRERDVNMPGEPFRDAGVDVDHDGVPDDGTAENARWDCDLDEDLAIDPEPAEAWLVEALLGPDHGLPYRDLDPSTLPHAPHEPFLNLDYPEGADDLSVAVDFRAGIGADARPVRDVDGDGVLVPGLDTFTGIARDRQGARLRMPVHVHGLVANLAGDVVVASGCTVLGAIRASGDVVIQEGARLLFDEGLARDGRPTDLALPRGLLSDVAWARTGAPGRGAPLPAPAEEEPEDDAASPPGAGGQGDGAAPGGRGGGPGPGSGSSHGQGTIRRR